MKPKRKTDNDKFMKQGEAMPKIKRPQFTSDFTTDNRLFYLYLDIIRQK
jgi:hypothetical protein